MTDIIPESPIVDPVTDTAPLNAEEAEPEVETEEPEETAASNEPEDKPKKKGGFQRRIDELTRERYEAQQQAQQAQAQLRELQRQQQEQAAQHAVDLPMPERDQFYSDEDYKQAVKHWSDSRLQAAEKQRYELAQQQAQIEASQRQQMALQQKIYSAQEKYPDFMAKVNDPSLPSLAQISPAAFHAIIASDKMADIAYHLANNPAEVYGFANLDPVQAVRQVVQMEARFNAQPTRREPPPAPPTTLKGKHELPKNLSEIKDINQWMEERNRQVRGIP